MTIWQELPRPFFVLAPMEAVTDHVFRRVVNSAAPADLYFSEFTNATGWVHAGEKAVAGRLTIHPDEKYPLIAQIWCSEPEDIAKLAQYCKKLGYLGIDLNMGCPAKTAVKNSGGSAMIREPELAAEIIAAAKTAGLPVSVKTRLGYSKLEEWQGWLGHLLKQDIAALTVHLRTKKEMSKVPAHWELMPEIKKLRDEIAPQTILLGNGDVKDRAHGKELIEQSGIDGVMIGRGVFHNPFAFEKTVVQHSKEELLALINLHLDLFETAFCHTESNVISSKAERSTTLHKQISRHARDDTKTQLPTSSIQTLNTSKPYQTLKRFFKIYVRDFPGSHDLRNQLMESHSVAEAREIVQQA